MASSVLGIALACNGPASSDRDDAMLTDSSADGGSGGDEGEGGPPSGAAPDGGNLNRCPLYGSNEDWAFATHPLNGLVIEGVCLPLGFSGVATVSRIFRSPDGVSRLELAVDGPGECGGNPPPVVRIVAPIVDWGLELGSEVRVSLLGNDDMFTWERVGAVVWHPDGSLLAAFFNKREDWLAPFLKQLPVGISFEPDCINDAQNVVGPFCYESATREAMVLSTGTILRERQMTTISVSGFRYHIALKRAIHYQGEPNGRCETAHTPPVGRTYRFLMSRLPPT